MTELIHFLSIYTSKVLLRRERHKLYNTVHLIRDFTHSTLCVSTICKARYVWIKNNVIIRGQENGTFADCLPCVRLCCGCILISYGNQQKFSSSVNYPRSQIIFQQSLDQSTELITQCNTYTFFHYTIFLKTCQTVH